jgi:hypothetical protein
VAESKSSEGTDVQTVQQQRAAVVIKYFPDFVIASPLLELTTKIWPENPIFSSYLVGTHTFVEYA